MTFSAAESILALKQITEQSIPAVDVVIGAVIGRYVTTEPIVVSGFAVRLTNCVGPCNAPIQVGLRVSGELRLEQATIPAYIAPLRDITASGLVPVPLDVAQEYRVAIQPPLELNSGIELTIEVLEVEETLQSGLTASLQLQGTYQLTTLRAPFREARGAGPICRIIWSIPEIICIGSELQNTEDCSPQNNSNIVSDPDGTLYQFTSFYSVDEQFGAGREGSYAHIFGFFKKPGTAAWQSMGKVVDPLPLDRTYAGDPFVFRDLDGIPHLVFCAVDGTRGFIDWTHIDAWVMCSSTDSFAGPWSTPWPLFVGLPGNNHDDRANCLRIYPRHNQRDYFIAWIHGEKNISTRGLITDDLHQLLTHRQILDASVLVRNQEEGGGGFVVGDTGYFTTWQIPGINDPTGIQRLYMFDLNRPLDPECWQAVPGSVGWCDPRVTAQDGGPTADAWSLSYLPDCGELWATATVWSASTRQNSVIAMSVPWAQRQDESFRFGVPDRVWHSHGEWDSIAPIIEYALGTSCALHFQIEGLTSNSTICIGIRASSAVLLRQAVVLEITDKGARLVIINAQGELQRTTNFHDSIFRGEQTYDITITRSDNIITAFLEGTIVGRLILEDSERELLTSDTRFVIFGARGGAYMLTQATIYDGHFAA